MSSERQPIVYSARYYSSPRRPERRSFFHLYRIDPDGTGRRQLTDAHADDRQLCWSPDGSRIAFLRTAAAYRETAGPTILCVCDLAGNVRELLRSTGAMGEMAFWWAGPDTLLADDGSSPALKHRIDVTTGRRRTGSGSWRIRSVAPDYRHALVEDPPGILRLADGVHVTLPPDVDETVWVTSTRVLCLRTRIVNDYRETVGIAEVGLDGNVGRVITPILSDTARLAVAGSPLPYCHLETIPGQIGVALLGSGRGGSSMGWWYQLLRVDLKTYRAEPWAEALEPAFAADGREFATSYNRTLTPYGTTGKELYVKPLLVARTGAPERQRPIVDGLVMVESADWRP